MAVKRKDARTDISKPTKSPTLPNATQWAWFAAGLITAGVGFAVAAARQELAPWVGLCVGLVVGVALGASGLVGSYDECWDEFWEATALSYLLGVLAVAVYLVRRERPGAFVVVESAAGTLAYLMLLFIPPLTWLGADLLLYAGTFAGWLLSGLFRPGYT